MYQKEWPYFIKVKVTFKTSKYEQRKFIEKFDQLAQRFQQEFQELIAEERAKLKAKIAEYNAEKERMKALTVNDNDIIY